MPEELFKEKEKEGDHETAGMVRSYGKANVFPQPGRRGSHPPRTSRPQHHTPGSRKQGGLSELAQPWMNGNDVNAETQPR